MDDAGRAIVHGLDDRLVEARQQAGQSASADIVAWIALGLVRDYVHAMRRDDRPRCDLVWAQMYTLSAGIDEWMANGPDALPFFATREERDAYLAARMKAAGKGKR